MKKLIALLIGTLLALYALTEVQFSTDLKYKNRGYENVIEVSP
jgi:hypothetical protein